MKLVSPACSSCRCTTAYQVVAISPFLSSFKKYNMRTTWFIPGHSLDTFPKEMAMVRDAGHEMSVPAPEYQIKMAHTPTCSGLHGYSHEVRASPGPPDLPLT